MIGGLTLSADLRPGVVHEGGGLTLLDLRELPWEPHLGIPGGLQKTLATAPCTSAATSSVASSR